MTCMTSQPPAKTPDPRLQVKLCSALLPPRPRYREKSVEELKKMEPLDELPEALIPGRVPSITRLPPLLRKGYHIPREAICRLIDETGFSPVPEGITPRFLAVLSEMEVILSRRLQWPIECSLVYGICGPMAEAIIVSVADSYNSDDEMPSVMQEKVKEQLGVEGPALWYLDSECSQWDWRALYGIQYA